MSKTTSKTVIFDCVTQTQEIREMNNDELLQLKEAKEIEQIREKEIATKVIARQAIADRLGLTAEEAQLLLGGN